MIYVLQSKSHNSSNDCCQLVQKHSMSVAILVFEDLHAQDSSLKALCSTSCLLPKLHQAAWILRHVKHLRIQDLWMEAIYIWPGKEWAALQLLEGSTTYTSRSASSLSFFVKDRQFDWLINLAWQHGMILFRCMQSRFRRNSPQKEICAESHLCSEVYLRRSPSTMEESN